MKDVAEPSHTDICVGDSENGGGSENGSMCGDYGDINNHGWWTSSKPSEHGQQQWQQQQQQLQQQQQQQPFQPQGGAELSKLEAMLQNSQGKVQELEKGLSQMKMQSAEVNRKLELQTKLMESFTTQMDVQQKQANVAKQQQDAMMKTLCSIQEMLQAKEGGGQQAAKMQRLADGSALS